jgi:Zn-dependent peptidase ImmA (M78 family)
MIRQNIQTVAYELLKKSGCMSLPVKVDKVADYLGVKIYPVKLPDDGISGVLDVRSDPIILINKDHAPHRQRFSIAHELGHFQLHHVSGIIHVDKKSYYRDAKSSEGLDEIEIAANKFAAALLMPEEFVRRELEKHEDFIDLNEDIIAELAQKFEVSATAMGFRIQNLGYSWF